MKKSVFYLLLCLTSLGMTAETYTPRTDDITLYLYLAELSGASAPYIQQSHVIFTYHTKRHIRGIAVSFKHESFRNRYVFTKSSTTSGLYYLALPMQDFPSTEIYYQYIVDGVRIHDPKNEQMMLLSSGAKISEFTFSETKNQLYGDINESPRTQFTIDFSERSNTAVKTIFDTYYISQDAPSYVSVVGNFNGWEPFFTPLTKESAKQFSVNVPRLSGTIYYYFFVDGERILDPQNTNIALDRVRGHRVSVLKLP